MNITIGTIKTIKYEYAQHECSVCGEPATNKITFLYENARNNPASSGFLGDDISYASDEEAFACEEHKEDVRRNVPFGMKWCATWYTQRDGQTIEENMSRVCYWKKIEETITP